MISCTAASYYKSPNIHKHKNLAETDTLIIRTQSSSVFVESTTNPTSKIEWSFPKAAKESYEFIIQQKDRKTSIFDTLKASNLYKLEASIRVFASAGTVINIQNTDGKTFVNHSGVVAVQSHHGEIILYMVRDHFWALNETGSIKVGLSDVFNQSGFIESRSGKVQIVTGSKENELHIQRSDSNTPTFIKQFKPVETSFEFPFLYIQSLSDSTSITKTGTILWN